MRIAFRVIAFVIIVICTAIGYANGKCQQASEEVAAGKWSAAKDDFVEGVNILQYFSWADSDLAVAAHCNLAMTLMNLGENEAAMKENDKAIAIGPNRPEPLLAQAEINTFSGKLELAVQNYKNFLAKFPDDRFAAQARSQMGQLQSELDAQLRATKSNKSVSSDYFGYATATRIFKWKPHKFPLKVYIPSEDETKKIANYRPQFATILRSAFAEWQKDSHNVVSFKFVDRLNQADIVCSWDDGSTPLKNAAEGGSADIEGTSAEGIEHAQITLLTKTLGGINNVPTDNLMHTAALHEIGHSLGLGDHSPNPGDVMFFTSPSSNIHKDLSNRDLKTLAHLYDASVPVSGSGNVHPKFMGAK